MSKLRDDFVKVTEVELKYRNRVKISDRQQISNSLDAYTLFAQVWDYDKIEIQEQFKIMLLDNKNTCLGISNVATGGINYCAVDAKIVFAIALKARATGIILAHNHPTGNESFSAPDEVLTENFKQVAKILGMSVLDHLVLTRYGYTSMSDIGKLPPMHFKL